MRACARCGQEAVVTLAYAGEDLCAKHFGAVVERRVLKEIRRQGPYPGGSKVAVAVSGGKDSVVALRLLHRVLAPRRDVTLHAVTVDEGIAAYRPPSLAVAEKAAADLGVPWTLVSYEDEAGVTMDEVVARKTEGLPCTYCGPLRRRSLNRAAKAVGATHLATGHNLDDVAQSVLMNTLRGDVQRAMRLGPHRETVAGLVPRLMPLRAVPEREVALYAILNGIPYHDGECPYAAGATRGRYRDLLLQLEEDEPGTRQRLVAGGDVVAAALRAAHPQGEPPGACATCGEAVAPGKATCRGCELLAALPR